MATMVRCAACDERFQVDERSLGKSVICPACGATTVAQAIPVGTTDNPLSLDDEPVSSPVPVPPTATRSRRFPWRIVGATLLTFLSMSLVYIGFQYGSGRIPESAWQPFAPEDAHCELLMPGTPTEEPIASFGAGTIGGRRYLRYRWLEKVLVAFAWYDLRENALPFVNLDGIAKRHEEELLARHPGKVTDRGVVNINGNEGREFVVETENGRWVERIILVASKPRARIFILGIGGPNISKEGVTTLRYLLSWRYDDKSDER